MSQFDHVREAVVLVVEPHVVLLDGPDEMAVQLEGDGANSSETYGLALGGVMPHIREQ